MDQQTQTIIADSCFFEEFIHLLAGRDVYVYAAELGPSFPLLRGQRECARYFEPCNFRLHMSCLQGSLAIRVPLASLIYGYDAKRVIDRLWTIRVKHFSERLPVRRLMHYRHTQAIPPAQQLEQSPTVFRDEGFRALLDAAAIKHHAHGETNAAHEYLEAALRLLPACGRHYALNWEHALDSWMSLTGDQARARDLLLSAMDACNVPALGQGLMIQLGTKYRFLLTEDEVHGIIPEARSVRKSAVPAYQAAFAWRLLGEQKRADACARRGMTKDRFQTILPGSLYWHLYPGEGSEQTVSGYLKTVLPYNVKHQDYRAFGEIPTMIMLCSDNLQAAGKYVSNMQYRCRSHESTSKWYAASLQIHGDSFTTAKIWPDLALSARSCYDWIQTAQRIRQSGAADEIIYLCLRFANKMATEPSDHQMLAVHWLAMLGDATESMKSFVKASGSEKTLESEAFRQSLYRSTDTRVAYGK